jgi:hypothetical protein
MNSFWSLLGYQTENVNEPELKAEVSGTIVDYKIIFPFNTSDTFTILSMIKKNSQDEYRIEIKLNSESKLKEWLKKFGEKNWSRVDPFRRSHVRWESTKKDLLLFFNCKVTFERQLKRVQTEVNQTLHTYTDDEKKEYVILILQE